MPLFELFGNCQKKQEPELVGKGTNEGLGTGSLCFSVLSFRHLMRAEVVEGGGKLVEPPTPIRSCDGFVVEHVGQTRGTGRIDLLDFPGKSSKNDIDGAYTLLGDDRYEGKVGYGPG